jgi:hypothetical protein
MSWDQRQEAHGAATLSHGELRRDPKPDSLPEPAIDVAAGLLSCADFITNGSSWT